MQDEKHKNTLQWYKQNLLEPLKTWLKGAKCTLKSGVLVVKTAFLEPLKKRKDNQIERQNGAKCKNGLKKNGAKLKIAAKSMFFNLKFR